jgi:hypothetical protein
MDLAKKVVSFQKAFIIKARCAEICSWFRHTLILYEPSEDSAPHPIVVGNWQPTCRQRSYLRQTTIGNGVEIDLENIPNGAVNKPQMLSVLPQGMAQWTLRAVGNCVRMPVFSVPTAQWIFSAPLVVSFLKLPLIVRCKLGRVDFF